MNKKLVYGVGINDADYQLTISEELDSIDGKRKQKIVWRCPYYSTWKRMLERSFSEREKERNPLYANVTCCDEWKTFSTFKKWMELQDWENKSLDKDILVIGNLVYSPNTCVFVEKELNSVFVNNSTGNYLLGVSKLADQKRNKSYVARCYFDGKTNFLGVYETEIEAHMAWLKKKIEILTTYSESNSGVIKTGIDKHIEHLKQHYSQSTPVTFI